MELQTIINNEIRDFINWFEEFLKNETISEGFKIFIIVKLVIILRSV